MDLVGSARSNEYGKATGGKPGDQKGGSEVSTQPWYLHQKGWVLIRVVDPDMREKIAHNMESACSNDCIGYCQEHRTSATIAAQKYGYDLSKVKIDVETDCSELVRCCCLYAGLKVGEFSTSTEITALKATGKVQVIYDDSYCTLPDKLLRGDILVTKTKGHTVIVLTNGSQANHAVSSGTNTVNKVDPAKSFKKELAGTYSVTASKLNMRFGAGIHKGVAKVLGKGTLVKCYGYYTDFAGGRWFLVKAGESTGYCSSKYLERL